MVSPWRTGVGKAIEPKPRVATVVPRVSSWTLSPTTRPRVKRLFTSRSPNSVFAANCWSRCRGWGFIVRVVKRTLSASVTVRVIAWATTCPISKSSNHMPAMSCLLVVWGCCGPIGGRGEHGAGVAQHRLVDHLPVEGHDAHPIGERCLVVGDEPAGSFDRLGCRAECRVGERNLAGMDAELARVADRTADGGVAPEPLVVGVGGHDLVEGDEAVHPRHERDVGAG